MTNTTTPTTTRAALCRVAPPDAATLAKVARMTDDNDHTHARFYVATWGEMFATSPATRKRMHRYRLIFGRIHHRHELRGHMTMSLYRRRERVTALMFEDMGRTELADVAAAFWNCL